MNLNEKETVPSYISKLIPKYLWSEILAEKFVQEIELRRLKLDPKIYKSQKKISLM